MNDRKAKSPLIEVLLRNRSWIICAIFLIALIIRLIYVIWYHQHSPISAYLEGDQLDYNTTAVNLVAGNGFWSSDHGGSIFRALPFYPLFLFVIYSLFYCNYFVVILIQTIIGATACVLVFLIAEKVFDINVATIAAFISAFCPYFVIYSAKIMTESLAILLVSLLVFTLIRYRKHPTLKNAMSSGVILGFTAILRSEVYALPLFLLVWLLLVVNLKKEVFLHFLLMVLVSGLIMTPWYTYHSIRQKRVVLINPSLGGTTSEVALTKEELKRFVWPPGGYKEYLRQLERRKERKLDYKPIYGAKVSDYLRINPTAYWRRFTSMFGLTPYRYHDAQLLVNIILLSLALLGMVVSWKKWKDTILFIFLVVCYTLPHLILGPHASRYSLPVRPCIMIFAAYGVVWIYKKAKSFRLLKS